jgi:hypothetical protein
MYSGREGQSRKWIPGLCLAMQDTAESCTLPGVFDHKTWLRRSQDTRLSLHSQKTEKAFILVWPTPEKAMINLLAIASGIMGEGLRHGAKICMVGSMDGQALVHLFIMSCLVM